MIGVEEIAGVNLRKAKEIALGKERDILEEGGLLVHFTRQNRISSILKEGVLSPETAKALGRKTEIEYPFKSLPEYVYMFEQSGDKEVNALLLRVYGDPGKDSTFPKNVAILISKEGLNTKQAIPYFPDAFTERKQRMIRGQIPAQNIVGIVIVAGIGKDYYAEDILSEIKDIVAQVENLSVENQELAVPVYDQEGRMLWPK